MQAVYDEIGQSYVVTRQPDPRIAQAIRAALGTAHTVLNVGAGTRYIHTHGHHPTLTHLDGYPVPKDARITRDTFEVGPAQRADLALRTGSDGVYAAGPGVWPRHA